MSGGERRGDGQEERNSTGKNEGWHVKVHNVNAQTVLGGLDKGCASLLGCCFHCTQAQGLLQCIGGREAFQAAVLKHGIVLSAHGPYSKSCGGSPNVVRVPGSAGLMQAGRADQRNAGAPSAHEPAGHERAIAPATAAD